jgi:hypothetical protein
VRFRRSQIQQKRNARLRRGSKGAHRAKWIFPELHLRARTSYGVRNGRSYRNRQPKHFMFYTKFWRVGRRTSEHMLLTRDKTGSLELCMRVEPYVRRNSYNNSGFESDSFRTLSFAQKSAWRPCRAIRPLSRFLLHLLPSERDFDHEVLDFLTGRGCTTTRSAPK